MPPGCIFADQLNRTFQSCSDKWSQKNPCKFTDLVALIATALQTSLCTRGGALLFFQLDLFLNPFGIISYIW